MSVRQQIVDAIKTRLELIHLGHQFTLPDGVYTCVTAPLSVTAWRLVPYSVAQTPAIALWDTGQTLEDGTIGKFTHQLEIAVVGFVSGSSAPAIARDMLADITAAVGSDPRWSGLAIWTEISDHTIKADQEADITAGCECKFTISYETGLWRL